MIVVKFGGHEMQDENGAFATATAAAQSQGVALGIVNGGGPKIHAAPKAEEISYEFFVGF